MDEDDWNASGGNYHPFRLVQFGPFGLIDAWRRSLRCWSSGQWPGCRDSHRTPSPHQWRPEALIEALVDSSALPSAWAGGVCRRVAPSLLSVCRVLAPWNRVLDQNRPGPCRHPWLPEAWMVLNLPQFICSMGMSSSSSCSSWTGESLNGDALLFDAGIGVGDFRGASPKILLRNGISTQVLYIQDRIGRDVESEIGCGCRHIFLEFQECLNVKGQHGIEELRKQNGNTRIKFGEHVGHAQVPQEASMGSAIPTPAKAKMSGPCFVLCARATQPRMPCSATWYEMADVHRH